MINRNKPGSATPSTKPKVGKPILRPASNFQDEEESFDGDNAERDDKTNMYG